MFTIAIQFLTQRVVAANASKHSSVEWPIHPARLFMSLAAAHYENDPTPPERKTLEWLEALPPPSIVAPVASIRETQTVFVPINDKLTGLSQRSKQPRQFPSAFVGDHPARFTWEVEIPKEHLDSLRSLAGKLVRIGHSSSLVHCWIEAEPAETDDASMERWNHVHRANGSSESVRVPSAGLLKSLDRSFNGEAIDQFAELTLTARDAETTKEKNAAKKELKERFPGGLPDSRRPFVGTTAVYQRESVSDETDQTLTTLFDPVLIAMTRIDGPALGLESTLEVCGMLRNAVLSKVGSSAPSWITGHDADGSSTEKVHLALVPLPFIGGSVDLRGCKEREYADGHLLGVGIVLPRDLTDRDKATGLGEFLVDEFGNSIDQQLTLGRNGVWSIRREDRMRPPKALTPETWSRSSHVWATATPIVLDRHPKTDRQKDPGGWRQEVGDIIGRSCRHIGLPQPKSIRVEKHGFLPGVPSASPSRTGFPLMKHSDGKTRRMQTHALIEFASPVQGPVILGSGRFRGYGFCKPVNVKGQVKS
ncbi:type I-U CRISPR-associated protein Csb2 [Stieleria marina]|uniref:CRISPR-associated protein n=1 Tax=Stieleria marina TaxID=1930275 RepID=A0A517P2K5_9BACT|nr:CRISPR-associated protein [Planctomycetes bacterium K23_9]